MIFFSDIPHLVLAGPLHWVALRMGWFQFFFLGLSARVYSFDCIVRAWHSASLSCREERSRAK